MTTERFIKFIPSEEADYLQEHHTNAFLLLCQIAKRGRRISGKPDGLEIGEAHIGDYKKAGIETRDKYRTALNILIQRAHIKKVETCRNRKKAPTVSPTGSTTIGTKVILLKSDIWDINPEVDNQQNPHINPHRTPTEPPPNPHEQERKKNDKKEERKEEYFAQTTLSLRSKVPEISFSFDNRSFENISPPDLESWKSLYPALDVSRELKAMAEWCLSNPMKAKSKKKWRSFITNWLSRGNEQKINRQAFQKNIFSPKDLVVSHDKRPPKIISFADEV